jgi:hypothetical protein
MALRDYVDEGPVGKRRLPVITKAEDEDEDDEETEAEDREDAEEAEPAPIEGEFDGAE